MRIAALPCKRQTCIFENKQHSQTNYKSYLRHGVVFNSHIFTNLLLSLPLKKAFSIGAHFAKLQARMWIAH